MTTKQKKIALDRATDTVAKIIGKQIEALPATVAAQKRKKLHSLALKVSRSSNI